MATEGSRAVSNASAFHPTRFPVPQQLTFWAPPPYRRKKKYNNNFKGYHQALTRAVLRCACSYADTLYAEGVRTLYLPMTLSLCEDERRALTAYVKAGGTLVLEAGAGSYRENGELEADGSFLRELLGMQSVNFDLLRAPETVYTLMAEGRASSATTGSGFAPCSRRQSRPSSMAALRFSRAASGRDALFGSALWAVCLLNTRDDATADLIASYANANGLCSDSMLSSSVAACASAGKRYRIRACSR
ncbi:MAG: beta-galactosidase trimerization domain-containing protein [Oscillospiraceae bacterium]